MNRTQKRILGWGLVFIGLVMVAGVVVSNRKISYDVVTYGDRTPRPPGGGQKDMLKSPLLYLGLVVVVAGAVVLKGDSKSAG